MKIWSVFRSVYVTRAEAEGFVELHKTALELGKTSILERNVAHSIPVVIHKDYRKMALS